MVGKNLAYKIDETITIPEVIVDDSPLKWCSVTLSDVLNKEKRLEASVFDIEAKQAWETITNGKYPCVMLMGDNGLIDTAFYPGRFKRIYCDKGNGEEFYLPSQITDIYPKPEKYISRLTKCDRSVLRLKLGTLLLTRSGTIGTVSLSSKTTEGKLFSDDVIRVTFKQKYDLGYCYAYLKSKIGSIILQTNAYGSVITHIEPEHLMSVPIPDAPADIKEKINDLIMESYAARDTSNELIDEATSLLVEELHLPDLSDFDTNLYQKNAWVDTFTVSLSKMAGRLDASYHVPIADAIVEHLKKYAAEVTTVGDPRISNDVILPGRFKRVYVDEGYGITFFSGKNISELDPSDKRYLSFAKHDKKIKEELTLRENMVLVTCSGTVGNVALVPRHWDGWAMTHDIIRLKLSDSLAGYCFIWLNSEYAGRIMKSFQYGSVVQHIEKEHIREMPIPLLKDQATQTRINDLALEANRKRYEAYTLEQKALKIMDNEVIFAK